MVTGSKNKEPLGLSLETDERDHPHSVFSSIPHTCFQSFSSNPTSRVRLDPAACNNSISHQSLVKVLDGVEAISMTPHLTDEIQEIEHPLVVDRAG